MARLDKSASHAELIISLCLSIDAFICLSVNCRFPIRRPFHVDIFISSGGLGFVRYFIYEYCFFVSSNQLILTY